MKISMIRFVTYSYPRLMLFVLALILVELSLRALRIGQYHPEIRTCSWSRVPGILWDTLAENRFHLLDVFRRKNTS